MRRGTGIKETINFFLAQFKISLEIGINDIEIEHFYGKNAGFFFRYSKCEKWNKMMRTKIEQTVEHYD